MTAPASTKHTCIHLADWPAADQAAWGKALEPPNPFKAGSGAAARLAPSTRDLIAAGYGRFLGWLREEALLDPDVAAQDRVTDQILLSYLGHLEGVNSPFTVASRLQQLGNAIKILAPLAGKHVVILRASYRVRSLAKPVRDKKGRVQPSDKVAVLGYDLIKQAASGPYLTPTMRAKLARDGLIILFLAYRGSRRQNLADIDIGRHLVSRGSELWLRFEQHEMKSKRMHEQPLPDELTPHLLRYIDEFRPILLACTKKDLPPTNALWISSHGTRMSPAAITYQVRNRTETAFGAPMTPHFFRDSIATTQAVEAPDYADDAAALLGHANRTITDKHYNQSNGVKVRSQYGEAVSRRRAEGCPE